MTSLYAYFSFLICLDTQNQHIPVRSYWHNFSPKNNTKDLQHSQIFLTIWQVFIHSFLWQIVLICPLYIKVSLAKLAKILNYDKPLSIIFSVKMSRYSHYIYWLLEKLTHFNLEVPTKKLIQKISNIRKDYELYQIFLQAFYATVISRLLLFL